jgi:bifunctional UDP-N-acetylglucosamine pyrophosphorylase/glucosamine-1-phosphate N-acetyltransferase
MNVDIIILAAGKGTRMQSPLPKVLQTLGHKSLLQHIVDTCADIKQSKLHIIVGDQKELVKMLRQYQNQPIG